MKIHFAYYNQFKNGIDIAFADNTLLFLSCVEAEKELHTTPNSQRLIDNLAIEDPLSYVAMALDGELQAWADAMDEDYKIYIFDMTIIKYKIINIIIMNFASFVYMIITCFI